eukprot:1183598-Prymnesium_polylepis.2
MDQAAMLALQGAQTEADIRQALITAAPFDNPAHPLLQQVVNEARGRLTRLERLRKLLADMTEPVPLRRNDSHMERLAMMTEANTRRSVGLDTALLEDTIKNVCKDFRCADCSEGSSYRSVCLQFMLTCLSIRLRTRLHFDTVNGYAIEPQITALMQRIINNATLVWLDENDAFMSLPNELDRMHATVVAPTAVDRKTKQEAREYNIHAKSIRKIIASIGRCEQATIASSVS